MEEEAVVVLVAIFFSPAVVCLGPEDARVQVPSLLELGNFLVRPSMFFFMSG